MKNQIKKGKTVKNKILDLLAFEKVNLLLEGFNKSTGFVTAILDLEGNVLSKSGWRKICTNFHRKHPETAKRCTESDTRLAGQMEAGEKYHSYKCLNGLIDVAVPIVINEEHVANLFTGQFFFEKPDRDFFIKQAEQYGFDKKKYLDALDLVPVVSEAKVKDVMDFLLNMTLQISEMTMQKIEQARLIDSLKVSEEKYRLLAENAIATIWVMDPQGNFTYHSPSVMKLRGYTPEEANNLSLEETMTPESLSLVQSLFKEENNKPMAERWTMQTIELEMYKKDGSIIYIETSFKGIRDIKGNITAIQGITVDITGRKQAELELQIESNKLISIFEAMEDGIYIVNREHDIQYVNSVLKKEFGFPDGIKCHKYFHDSDKPCAFCKNEDVFAGKTVQWEWTSAKNGKTYDLIDTPLKNSDGGISKLEIFRDIGYRKKAEDALKENGKKLQQAQYIAGMGDFTWNIQTGEASWSDGMYKLLKYDKDDEIDFTKVNEKIHHPDDLERVTKWFMDSIASGNEKIEANEYRLICKNGETIYVQTNGTINYKNGKAVQLFGTCLDITKRTRVEQALKSSEERFRTLMEQSPIATSIMNPEGRIVSINNAYKKLWEITLDDLSDYNILHDEQAKTLGIMPGIEKAFAGESVILSSIEYDPVGAVGKGRKRWLHPSIYPIKDINGKVMEVVMLDYDITDRKKAEEALKKSEEKLRNIFENSTNIFYSHTVDNTITYISPQVEDFLGYSQEEALIKWTEFASENPLNEIGFENTMKAIKTGIPQPPYELELVRKNGKKIRVEVREAPILENGKTNAIVGSLTDITVRKQAEVAVRVSEKKYRDLFQKSTDALLIMENGKFVDYNQAILKMLGYTHKDAIMNFHPSQLSPPTQPDGRDSAEKADEMITIALKKGSHRFEWQHKRANGEIFPAEVLLTAILTKKDKQVIHVIWRDLTEQKLAEKELEKHREHLEELVLQRTTELEEKNAFLERTNDAMVNREFRIKDLNDEIKELQRKLKD
jgi:PAS domain S-box-containing protein